MCISNGLDAGLISNALWKGFSLREIITRAGPLSDGHAGAPSCSRQLHRHHSPGEGDGSDNAACLRDERRAASGPARVSLAGDRARLFRRETCEWLTRIELATDDAKGFYENQGWGPDFITPTRSRIDVARP